MGQQCTLRKMRFTCIQCCISNLVDQGKQLFGSFEAKYVWAPFLGSCVQERHKLVQQRAHMTLKYVAYED